MKNRLSLFLIVFFTNATALADTCFVSYAEYEASIPHFDIHRCPAPRFEKDKGFCRLGLQGTEVLIYHFELANNASCLIAIDKYEFNEFAKKYGSRYTY